MTVILFGMMIEHWPDGICPLTHVAESLNAPERAAVNNAKDEVAGVVVSVS